MNWLCLAARLVLSLILTWLAIADLRQGHLPNIVVMPLLLIAAALAAGRLALGRLTWSQAGIIVVVWAICLLAWKVRLFGGGDIKLVMALIAFFPDGRLLWILLGIAGPAFFLLLGRRGLRQSLRRQATLVFLAAQGQFPTCAEIEAAYRRRGDRITFVPALAGLIYTWLILPPPG